VGGQGKNKVNPLYLIPLFTNRIDGNGTAGMLGACSVALERCAKEAEKERYV